MAAVSGTVIELLPALRFRVELEDRRRVVAHAPAASKANFVRLRPGDQVAVELSPKDATRGRITGKVDQQVKGRARAV